MSAGDIRVRSEICARTKTEKVRGALYMSNPIFHRCIVAALGLLCSSTALLAQDSTTSNAASSSESSNRLETATFGGGCFWCVEAVFENMQGVRDVVSGYAGGGLPNPSYQQVSTGLTGHAEVCQIYFDPKKVSYSKLLEVFMKTHDPTTRDRQGPDRGSQYRSVIFYHSDEQKTSAETLIERLNAEEAFRSKVVTQVVPFTQFYLAEEYHQNYYRKHPNESYCKTYVRPKIAKFRKVIRELEQKEKQK